MLTTEINPLGCPTGLFSWADTLDTKIKTQKMGKNILYAKLNNFSGHEKSLSRKKKHFGHKFWTSFQKQLFWAEVLGRKGKSQKLTVNRNAENKDFFLFSEWVLSQTTAVTTFRPKKVGI